MKPKPWHLVALAPVLGVAWALWGASSSEERVTFLSVGQGDCTVYESKGATLLIDTGKKDDYTDAGERIVVPKLMGMDIHRVDVILLTHPDSDHVGGTGAVLRAFPGAKVAISRQFQGFPTFVHWQKQWGLLDEDLLWLPESGDMKLGDWKIHFVCPPREGDDTNSGSVVTHAVMAEASITASGDAPIEVEERLAGQGIWKADLLKLGHHGSRTSTGPRWLAAVRPRWAIASAGKDNPFGHPSQLVLQRCKQAGVEVLRTDEIGDIQFRVSDGKLTRIR